MYLEEELHVGDKVSVDFHNSRTTVCHYATVLRLKTTTNDTWIFRDDNNGQTFYISEPCTIARLARIEDLKRQGV